MASSKAATSEPTAAPPPSSDLPHHQTQPQSQSQSQSHAQSQAKSQSQPQPQPQSKSQSRASGTSATEYYGYLLNKDKSATDILDALLRAIGLYISANLGDRNVRELTPKKLAAFYHAVGGDYDSLFINCPYKSISYIWQALGVQHSLQPTDNPFEAPSIPALTLKGFVRWETIQILLEPQEHAPFVQFAVRNWALVHPDTGKPFPTNLPREALPAESDPAIDAWHKDCAKRLREEATPKDEDPPRRRASDPRIHTTFAHVRNPQSNSAAPRQRGPEMDYFQRERPVSYTHVPSTNYAAPNFSANYSPGQRRGVNSGHSGSSSIGSSSGDSPRRRAYSDARHPEMENHRASTHLDPRHPLPPRRHSHSRPYAASPSDSDSDIPPHSSSKSRAHGPIPPPPSVRHMPVEAPVTSAIPVRPRPRRSDFRSDDVRRKSFPAEIKQRFTSFLSGSAERQRSSSREKHHVSNVPPTVHFRREIPPPSRLSRSVSGESYAPSDESDPDAPPTYPSRRDRERERVRERIEKERQREREREREEELERRSHDRAYLRPVSNRRASSHADIERRTRDYTWDRRDRDRDSDYDRDGRRVVTADERETRDRRRYKDRGPSPGVTGVGGRRYPGEPSWK
ncbi:hypothetical protein GGR54DRAFT_445403 [Hypoxylon sp. NC1633]|nr:hypothetical protein GGR54DRAFT_445403 [Hypoxylon sp. NC1633]